MKSRIIAVVGLTLAVFVSYVAPAWADLIPDPPKRTMFLPLAGIFTILLIWLIAYALLKRVAKGQIWRISEARRERSERKQVDEGDRTKPQPPEES